MTKGQEIVAKQLMYVNISPGPELVQLIDAAIAEAVTQRTKECAKRAEDYLWDALLDTSQEPPNTPELVMCYQSKNGAFSQEVEEAILAIDKPKPVWCADFEWVDTEELNGCTNWKRKGSGYAPTEWLHCPFCGAPRPT